LTHGSVPRHTHIVDDFLVSKYSDAETTSQRYNMDLFVRSLTSLESTQSSDTIIWRRERHVARGTAPDVG